MCLLWDHDQVFVYALESEGIYLDIDAVCWVLQPNKLKEESRVAVARSGQRFPKVTKVSLQLPAVTLFAQFFIVDKSGR